MCNTCSEHGTVGLWLLAKQNAVCLPTKTPRDHCPDISKGDFDPPQGRYNAQGSMDTKGKEHHLTQALAHR